MSVALSVCYILERTEGISTKSGTGRSVLNVMKLLILAYMIQCKTHIRDVEIESSRFFFQIWHIQGLVR